VKSRRRRLAGAVVGHRMRGEHPGPRARAGANGGKGGIAPCHSHPECMKRRWVRWSRGTQRNGEEGFQHVPGDRGLNEDKRVGPIPSDSTSDAPPSPVSESSAVPAWRLTLGQPRRVRIATTVTATSAKLDRGCRRGTAPRRAEGLLTPRSARRSSSSPRLTPWCPRVRPSARGCWPRRRTRRRPSSPRPLGSGAWPAPWGLACRLR
jgi:hypothetical protein